MTATLSERYRHKIKTPTELRELLGAPPREKKVIMCHGVFDVVHPGHIRHLVYAKSKADILIASLTADRHITKGEHRPHVPQELRALNLAAFEVVDYVVIDRNDKPLENIGIIQPDFFAKGYEYTANGVRPATAEEATALSAYGGEIIYTPGDVVFSSSALINEAPPALKLEKLQVVMDSRGVTFDQLRDTLRAMHGRHVHVVGDTIVDSYTHCALIGGHAKTPTLSVRFERQVDFLGGAAIVAKHLRAAGALVSLSTVLGDDKYGELVVRELHGAGVKVNAVVDGTRPTVNKNAIVVDGYRLLKIDTVDNGSIGDSILAELVEAVADEPAEAVIYSDYRHGIFNGRTIPRLIAALRAGVFKVADSQVASRWGNITEFKGFDLIMPNEHEARFAVADQDSGIRPLASKLYDAAECKLLMLTLGERGVLTCHSPFQEQRDSFFFLDSFVDRLVDAVGSGDAMLAYSTLAMLASRNEAVAAILGSMAAACECEFDGNVPITPEHVSAKLATVERAMNYDDPSTPPS
jgi:rfaE bifunctional protein kinase chain/domain